MPGELRAQGKIAAPKVPDEVVCRIIRALGRSSEIRGAEDLTGWQRRARVTSLTTKTLSSSISQRSTCETHC